MRKKEPARIVARKGKPNNKNGWRFRLLPVSRVNQTSRVKKGGKGKQTVPYTDHVCGRGRHKFLAPEGRHFDIMR